MLKVKNIAANYDGTIAIRDISLEVNKGEIVSIIGSNGAGKTTTLKAISGIVRVSQGKIEFKGKTLNKFLPHQIVKMGISQCPEGRQLWPEMTVLETLEMGAFLRSDRISIEDDIEKIMSIFPVLSERKNQLAKTLSGGEQQALAIGRALMARPELILFDEPSLGLAPILVEKMFGTIQSLREEGLTIILVEQNANAALKISNRTYILEKGKIALQGNSRELLNNEMVKKIYLGFS